MLLPEMICRIFKLNSNGVELGSGETNQLCGDRTIAADNCRVWPELRLLDKQKKEQDELAPDLPRIRQLAVFEGSLFKFP